MGYSFETPNAQIEAYARAELISVNVICRFGNCVLRRKKVTLRVLRDFKTLNRFGELLLGRFFEENGKPVLVDFFADLSPETLYVWGDCFKQLFFKRKRRFQ